MYMYDVLLFLFSSPMQLSLAERLQQALAGLGDLLDWVKEAEHRLGSEQPMTEVPKNLGAQAKDHKVRSKVTFYITCFSQLILLLCIPGFCSTLYLSFVSHYFSFSSMFLFNEMLLLGSIN